MITIAVVIVFLLTFFGCLVGIPVFLIWVLNQASQASMYRKMMAEKSPPPLDQWTVTYTVGRKKSVSTVTGKTEEEALQNFVKKIKHDKIVSVTKD